jgi:NitT/TauT family transport system substrate-binding protein
MTSLKQRVRRFALAPIALAALVVAACSAPAPAAPATSAPAAKPSLIVQLNFLPNAEHYGITYADRAGLYAAQNLDVKVNPGGQGVDGLQMVAAGAATIAVSDPASVLTAINQNIPIVAFAAEFHKTPQAMICRKDRGINGVGDLGGRTFGVKSAGGEESTRAFLDKNKIDTGTINHRPSARAR